MCWIMKGTGNVGGKRLSSCAVCLFHFHTSTRVSSGVASLFAVFDPNAARSYGRYHPPAQNAQRMANEQSKAVKNKRMQSLQR